MISFRNRRAVAALLVCFSSGCATEPPPNPSGEGKVWDLEAMMAFVKKSYCCLGEKQTDLALVERHYRPLAAAAKTKGELVAVLEAALDELYDPHTHLGVNLPSSPRLPPHDLWAEWREGKAIVLGVRGGSAAERSGVRVGDVVLAVDGVPVAAAAKARGPHFLRAPDPGAELWALQSALAGRHDRARSLTLRAPDGTERTVTLDDLAEPPPEPDFFATAFPDGFAYFRIGSFADPALVASFDAALLRHRNARGLVIDVRNNHGGDTAVARPIMGRFLFERTAYALMARREGDGLSERWTEYVEPRGPFTYTAPIVILVDRFSESMAEGFAMGLAGMGRAQVAGTRMAGLGAGVARTELPRSRIPVQLSAEPVYQLDGSPRNLFVPEAIVDLESAAPGADAILDAGLTALKQRARR